MNKAISDFLIEKTSFQVKAPESKRKVVSGTKRMRHQPIIWQNVCQKLHKIKEIGPRGDGGSGGGG